MPGRSDFIERSIAGALFFIKESVFAEEYAAQKGLLQSLDPRIKTATFLFFILQALFAGNILVLFCLYALCLALARFSGINLVFFLKRTWIFIPLFSLFIALPALFSVFSPGQAVMGFALFGLKLTITQQGLSGASLFVMRVLTSVSLVVLLGITTRHSEILKVLRMVKVPQLFVMTAGMCYRYLYLFLEIIENTYLAIKGRVGTKVHCKRGQGIVAWNIASLWSRSYYLNEAVYKAMLSRGYRGEPAVLDDFKVKASDGVWLFIVMLISLGLY